MTLDDCELDADDLKDIEEAKKEIAEGKYYTTEQLREVLGIPDLEDLDFKSIERIEEDCYWIGDPQDLPTTLEEVAQRMIRYAARLYERVVVGTVYMAEAASPPDWSDVTMYGTLTFRMISCAVALKDGFWIPVNWYMGNDPRVYSVNVKIRAELMRHNPTEMIISCVHFNGKNFITRKKTIELLKFSDCLHNTEMTDVPAIVELASERAEQFATEIGHGWSTKEGLDWED